MEKSELIKVYGYAGILWNTFEIPKQTEKQALQGQIWYDFLKDYDLETIFASMRELSKESDFCNIGKVAKGCQTICNLMSAKLDEEDIFKEINGAISFYNTQDKFDKLSDVAKKVVGTAGQLSSWAGSDVDTFNSVIASQIKKSIRNQFDRQAKIESVGIGNLKMLEEAKNKKLLTE